MSLIHPLLIITNLHHKYQTHHIHLPLCPPHMTHQTTPSFFYCVLHNTSTWKITSKSRIPPQPPVVTWEGGGRAVGRHKPLAKLRVKKHRARKPLTFEPNTMIDFAVWRDKPPVKKLRMRKHRACGVEGQAAGQGAPGEEAPSKTW